MRRTMVVSVFAGCGKTWLTNHQNQYGYSMRDSDSSTYEKTAGWEKEYINSFMEEAKSGKYDLNNTSVAITQTGGGCRATNYIGFLRKALYEAGFKDIPVISISANGIEDNGLKENISFSLINRAIMGTVYGDLLMKVLYRVRPYEKGKGSANQLYDKWVEICKDSLKDGKFSTFNKNIKKE